MEQQLMLKRGPIYQTAQRRHRINIYNMSANDTWSFYTNAFPLLFLCNLRIRGDSVAYLQSMTIIDMWNLKPVMYHLMDEVSMEQRKRFIYIL